MCRVRWHDASAKSGLARVGSAVLSFVASPASRQRFADASKISRGVGWLRAYSQVRRNQVRQPFVEPVHFVHSLHHAVFDNLSPRTIGHLRQGPPERDDLDQEPSDLAQVAVNFGSEQEASLLGRGIETGEVLNVGVWL